MRYFYKRKVFNLIIFYSRQGTIWARNETSSKGEFQLSDIKIYSFRNLIRETKLEEVLFMKVYNLFINLPHQMKQNKQMKHQW